MHPLDVSILEVFRREPAKSFATTEMVRDVFKEEWAVLSDQLRSNEKHAIRRGYAQKAKLHRKLLYHVNKLLEQQLLVVAGTRGKGEKLFRLAMEEGELIVQGGAHKIVISKPESVTTKIDGDEQDGFVRKFLPGTWLTKHDAILLDGLAFPNLTALQQRLQQVFPLVSDAIAVIHFEHIVGKTSQDEVEHFLRSLALDAHDYDVAVTLSIALGEPGAAQLLPLLRRFLPDGLPRRLAFVFNLTPRDLTRHEQTFRELFTIFSEGKWKLTLKNGAIFAPPVFFGRAGPYAFSNADWDHFLRNIRGKTDSCVVAQTSLVVDITRFFESGGTITGFREMLARVGHAFFEVDEHRRRHEFSTPPMASPDASKEFFKTGRNYVRFWNYDWEEERYPLIELLGSVKEDLDRFCATQETIFKSCGLPIRFRIGMSSSFAKFDEDFFSDRRYSKTAIASTKDLQTKAMKRYLSIRERLFGTFEGADRLRFFLARGVPVEESLHMARYLLSAYDLPSFTFDYQGKSGELKLTSFLEGA
jgi:hypothetical protein